MNRRVLVILAVLAAVAVFVIAAAIVSPDRTPAVSEEELGKLVARARLVWDDYGEGVKAALGATPAAEWHGAPAEVRLQGDEILVRFDLRAPWASYPFGVPILLRDPEGHVSMPVKYARGGGGGVYIFPHSGPVSALAVPWVELRYPPNEEKRVVFDLDGVWRAKVGD